MSQGLLTLPPLGLYIHIPWCVRKCPYCDFNSHKAEEHLPEEEYVQALIADLDQEAAQAEGRKLSSIFIGGGTPSLFSAQAIGRILEACEKRLGFADAIEITMEANPGTFEQMRFNDFRHAGLNRLSIGIQSFQDAQLQHLGRIHGRDEGLRAVEMARAAGFENINLDLMHGLPAQSVDAAMADLQQAIAFAPEHLSWYQLTIEQNTEFYAKPPTLPVEDILCDIQDEGQVILANAGFQHYEVSAFAQPGRASRHNQNYWTFGDYIGIGAGAHGKLTSLANNAIVRRHKTRQPKHYLDSLNSPLGFKAHPSPIEAEKRKLEFLMNALRLNQGVDIALYEAHTGLSRDSLQPQWQNLQNQGLLELGTERLQPTSLGQRFLNSLLEGFLD